MGLRMALPLVRTHVFTIPDGHSETVHLGENGYASLFASLNSCPLARSDQVQATRVTLPLARL
jgi:hypothetical protein